MDQFFRSSGGCPEKKSILWFFRRNLSSMFIVPSWTPQEFDGNTPKYILSFRKMYDIHKLYNALKPTYLSNKTKRAIHCFEIMKLTLILFWAYVDALSISLYLFPYVFLIVFKSAVLEDMFYSSLLPHMIFFSANHNISS